MTSKTTQASAEKLKDFEQAWRKKVRQYLTPVFSPETRGAWVLRFDDVLADALELGKLKNKTVSLSEEQKEAIAAAAPTDIPAEVIETLAAYCIANKPEDSDRVVIPVANFDAYFGGTTFSRKWLSKIPASVLERTGKKYGICRMRLHLNV